MEQKDQQIVELTRQLASAQHQLKILQHQVEQLLRRTYGRRSEKLDPNQLMFDNLILQAADQPVEAVKEEPEDEPDPPRRRKRNNQNHPGRIPIPDHLERVEIILDIPEEEKVCPETDKPLKQIGWEISEKLEYRPGKLLVNVYKRPKYASPDSMASGEVGIIIAPKPDHPILKCKADAGLLSHIIVSKFANHLALGRKDWLFAGSERGGRAAALFYSLVQSCKACEVNPWEYFNDVLKRIMSHPMNSLRELLPDQWQPLPKDERGLIVQPR